MEELNMHGHEIHNVDASLFFLFESSGDSELDARFEHGLVMEEDDAESCSYDDDDDDDLALAPDHHPDAFNLDGEFGGKEGGGEEEDVVEEGVGVEGGGGGFNCYKSCVSVESNGGDLTCEMERNKLFWEACLAS